MHINEILLLADCLRSLIRRADMFGPKTREEILDEIEWIAKDLEKQVAKMDRDMELEYMADYAEYVRG